MGNQGTGSNGHQSDMEPKEVFQTLKEIQVGNERFRSTWNNRITLINN